MTPTIKQSDWFTNTSDEPYDRHFYIANYPDDRTYAFEDYEHLRAHWFQQADTHNATVTVMDMQQHSATKGFG